MVAVNVIKLNINDSVAFKWALIWGEKKTNYNKNLPEKDLWKEKKAFWQTIITQRLKIAMQFWFQPETLLELLCN